MYVWTSERVRARGELPAPSAVEGTATKETRKYTGKGIPNASYGTERHVDGKRKRKRERDQCVYIHVHIHIHTNGEREAKDEPYIYRWLDGIRADVERKREEREREREREREETEGERRRVSGGGSGWLRAKEMATAKGGAG